MISVGAPSITSEDVLKKVSEAQLLSYYFNINKIPCIIHSPLRKDESPSFGIYTKDGIHFYYKDFATNEQGDTFKLLSLLWNISRSDTLLRIYNTVIGEKEIQIDYSKSKSVNVSKGTIEVQCKIREWQKHDVEYWDSFGISKEWLQYAEIYPISHKIIIKDSKKYVFAADKYAYVYVEHKENHTTLKIYQPYNTNGYKWTTNHDGSVISLWTKIPKEGNIVCICSSVKDALCLWANTGIPSIAVQGEGYPISNTAINELHKRFRKVIVILDNDKPGLAYAEKLCKDSGFTNVILPRINEAKDISDLYKSLDNKNTFKEIIINTIKKQLK